MIAVNGEPVDLAPQPGTYLELKRVWQTGDTIRLHLPMAVRRITCHLAVEQNLGRVALMRGPLLYCLEGIDNPNIDLRGVELTAGTPIEATFRPDLLGGVMALTTRVERQAAEAAWNGQLYRSATSRPATNGTVALTAVPYHLWANREPGAMQVWLRARQ